MPSSLSAVVFAVLFGRLVEVTMFREGAALKTARVSSNASYLPRRHRRSHRRNFGDRFASGVALCGCARRLGSGRDGRGAAGIVPGLDAAALTKKLQSRQAFVWIKRNMPPRQQEAVRQLGIPGLHFRVRAAARLSEWAHGGACAGLCERRQPWACRCGAWRRRLDPREAQQGRRGGVVARPARSACTGRRACLRHGDVPREGCRRHRDGRR